MTNDGDWAQWSFHVLAELERLNVCHESTNKRLDQIMAEITDLKVKYTADITALNIKSGIWGAFAGCIPVIIYIAIKVL